MSDAADARLRGPSADVELQQLVARGQGREASSPSTSVEVVFDDVELDADVIDVARARAPSGIASTSRSTIDARRPSVAMRRRRPTPCDAGRAPALDAVAEAVDDAEVDDAGIDAGSTDADVDADWPPLDAEPAAEATSRCSGPSTRPTSTRTRPRAARRPAASSTRRAARRPSTAAARPTRCACTSRRSAGSRCSPAPEEVALAKRIEAGTAGRRCGWPT